MKKNTVSKTPLYFAIACLLLIVVGALMIQIKSAHSLIADFLLGLGAGAGTIGLCLALASAIKYNASKTLRTAIFCAVVYALTYIAAIAAGEFGALSYGIMHTLCDGMLAALLVATAICLLRADNLIVAVVIAGVIGALLTVLNLNTVGNIYLALLGVSCLVCAVIKRSTARGRMLGAVLLGVFTTVLSLLAIFSGRHDYLHVLLHTAAIICAAALTYGAYSLLVAAAAARTPAKASASAKSVSTPASQAPAKSAQPDKSHTADKSAAKDEAEELAAKWVTKAYRDKSYAEICDAPVDALYGVSEDDAKLLKESFGIDTVRELAENRFFNWAVEIVEEADRQNK